ncbi:MAG TPA: hypothetical protein VIK78_00365 [Ruminiclostridium sp.]
MSANTINYSFVKPALNETADIEVINSNMDIIDTEIKERETEIGTLSNTVSSHMLDYTLQVPYGGTATNVGNVYSIAAPVITALSAGMAVCVKCNVDSSGAVTFNWNGKGAKSVLKANQSVVTNWKANGIYTMRYDGTNFILQGEGGSGNAIASDLALGKTAATDVGDIVGTNTNKKWAKGTVSCNGTNFTYTGQVMCTLNLDFIPTSIRLSAIQNVTYKMDWHGTTQIVDGTWREVYMYSAARCAKPTSGVIPILFERYTSNETIDFIKYYATE